MPQKNPKNLSALMRLQTWYQQQCDGVWEHASGVLIQSCDNPGWWVKVNLRGTSLQGRPFAEVAEGVNAQRSPLRTRWVCCHIDGDTWNGAGDETKLENIIEVFLAWAEATV